MTREEMRKSLEWQKNYWFNVIHEAVEHAQEDCEDCRKYKSIMQMYLDDAEHAEQKIIGMLLLARSCAIISSSEHDEYLNEVLAYWKDAWATIRSIANN